jgi:hypothetical protein
LNDPWEDGQAGAKQSTARAAPRRASLFRCDGASPLSDVRPDELQVTLLARRSVRVPSDGFIHGLQAGAPDVVRHIIAKVANALQQVTQHHDPGIGILRLVAPLHAKLQRSIDDAIIDARVVPSAMNEDRFNVLQDIQMIARHVFHARLGCAIMLVGMDDVFVFEEPFGRFPWRHNENL